VAHNEQRRWVERLLQTFFSQSIHGLYPPPMRKFTHSGQIWTAFLTIYAFKTNSALPATKPLPMSNSAHLHDLILLLFFLQFLLYR
jgi:hypothetical protein